MSRMERERMRSVFWPEDLMKDVGVEERRLKCVFNKKDIRTWTGFSWLLAVTEHGLLLNFHQ
jgi:hypothetical protein